MCIVHASKIEMNTRDERIFTICSMFMLWMLLLRSLSNQITRKYIINLIGFCIIFYKVDDECAIHGHHQCALCRGNNAVKRIQRIFLLLLLFVCVVGLCSVREAGSTRCSASYAKIMEKETTKNIFIRWQIDDADAGDDIAILPIMCSWRRAHIHTRCSAFML